MQYPVFLWLLISGGIAGVLVWRIYKILPTAWLIEYGETLLPPELEPERRSRFWPDGVFLMALASILALAGWLRIPPVLPLVLYALASLVMMLILLADWKTRIIPDPLSLVLAVLALLTAISQILANGWSWAQLGLRLLAGIAAGAIFLLIGWIGSRLAGQDAMGMGDVKLIIPCVWMIDFHLAFSLVFLSFLTASLLAVPLLIQKYAPRKSAAKTDGALAFGPFIVIATWLVLLLEPEIMAFWQFYLGQFR